MQNTSVANGQSFCGAESIYGTRISRPEYLFIKELLLGASGDSPAEIREWCKSDLCRLFCNWMDIDINDYRKGMLRIVLDRKDEAHPRVKTHADDHMVSEETEKPHLRKTTDEIMAKVGEVETLTTADKDTFEFVFDVNNTNYVEETDELIREQRKLGPLFANAYSDRMAAR